MASSAAIPRWRRSTVHECRARPPHSSACHTTRARRSCAAPRPRHRGFAQRSRSPSTNAWSEAGIEILAGRDYADAGDVDLSDRSARHAAAIERAIADIVCARRLSDLARRRSLGDVSDRARDRAQRRREFTIVQIDAHPDLYDNFEGDRFSHACPFARILEEHSSVTSRAGRHSDDDRSPARAGAALRRRRDRHAVVVGRADGRARADQSTRRSTSTVSIRRSRQASRTASPAVSRCATCSASCRRCRARSSAPTSSR